MEGPSIYTWAKYSAREACLLLNQMELNHHAKDFLSTESLLMNGLIHIPVNLIQMSWRPISLLAMHCGLVSGLSCVKGLIFSPSKTCCGTSHTIWDMDWERKLVYELKKNIPLLTLTSPNLTHVKTKRCYTHLQCLIFSFYLEGAGVLSLKYW